MGETLVNPQTVDTSGFVTQAAVDAKVTQTITNGVTTTAPSEDAVFDALALKIPLTYLDVDGTLAANSDTRLATQKAVKTYADQLIAASDAMVFKGVIDASTSPNYPAADRGHSYRISVAGKIGGGSGTNVEAGDLILCMTDSTAAGNQATVGSAWSIAQANLDGAVIGPPSAVSTNLASFSGITGKLIQDSGLNIDTDTALAANSDTKLASQKAVKTFVTGKITQVITNGVTTTAPSEDAVFDALALKALLQETVVAGGNTGAAKTIADVTTGTIHSYTLTANCTFTFPTAGAGKSFLLHITQDTTPRTVTWPGTVKWPSGTAPTLSTGSGKIDVFSFVCVDGTNWVGATAGQNY